MSLRGGYPPKKIKKQIPMEIPSLHGSFLGRRPHYPAGSSVAFLVGTRRMGSWWTVPCSPMTAWPRSSRRRWSTCPWTGTPRCCGGSGPCIWPPSRGTP
ncbi:unnamed protein product [Triticum turgidum subsp. durum]|uniref:Uncharacterized protein n=1 Tax=Triticum turgidum subsp. durum TaxID=4567 RepID=A0A9R0ZW38_TRITD|nr:unnamed protein product [Triticum turgidum subsp. durum]